MGNTARRRHVHGAHSSITRAPQCADVSARSRVFGTLGNINSTRTSMIPAVRPRSTHDQHDESVSPLPQSTSTAGGSQSRSIPANHDLRLHHTAQPLVPTLAGMAANNTNPTDPNNFNFDAVTYNAQGFACSTSPRPRSKAGTIFCSNITGGEDRRDQRDRDHWKCDAQGNFSFGSPNDPAAKWRRRSSGISSRPAPPVGYDHHASDWFGATWRATIVREPLDIDGFLYANTLNGGTSNGAERNTTDSTAPCRRRPPRPRPGR